jgi:hypothetical protein
LCLHEWVVFGSDETSQRLLEAAIEGVMGGADIGRQYIAGFVDEISSPTQNPDLAPFGIDLHECDGPFRRNGFVQANGTDPDFFDHLVRPVVRSPAQAAVKGIRDDVGEAVEASRFRCRGLPHLDRRELGTQLRGPLGDGFECDMAAGERHVQHLPDDAAVRSADVHEIRRLIAYKPHHIDGELVVEFTNRGHELVIFCVVLRHVLSSSFP